MSNTTMSHDLRQQFEQECRESAPAFLSASGATGRRSGSSSFCDVNALEHTVSVIGRLADDLNSLISSSSHLSVEQMQPAIRRIIEQRGYLAEAGDLKSAEDYSKRVDLYVAIVSRVITRLRSQSRFGGQWADKPVTPMMFG